MLFFGFFCDTVVAGRFLERKLAADFLGVFERTFS